MAWRDDSDKVTTGVPRYNGGAIHRSMAFPSGPAGGQNQIPHAVMDVMDKHGSRSPAPQGDRKASRSTPRHPVGLHPAPAERLRSHRRKHRVTPGGPQHPVPVVGRLRLRSGCPRGVHDDVDPRRAQRCAIRAACTSDPPASGCSRSRHSTISTLANPAVAAISSRPGSSRSRRAGLKPAGARTPRAAARRPSSGTLEDRYALEVIERGRGSQQLRGDPLHAASQVGHWATDPSGLSWRRGSRITVTPLAPLRRRPQPCAGRSTSSSSVWRPRCRGHDGREKLRHGHREELVVRSPHDQGDHALMPQYTP